MTVTGQGMRYDRENLDSGLRVRELIAFKLR